ncbi:hypothetical protein Q7P35_001717 [Cladosporium inversicolor]
MPLPPNPTFADIYTHITTNQPYPVLPSASPHPRNPDLSHAISSLAVHPTLEALLHILNSDLSSAHFLVRHMEAKPAVEGMFVHGILHRVEGDYRNAEAWYRDVKDSDIFRSVWPEEEGKEKKGDLADLEMESQRELDATKDFLVERFGLQRVEDATTVWVGKSEEGKKQHAGQVVGGEGWRQF